MKLNRTSLILVDSTTTLKMDGGASGATLSIPVANPSEDYVIYTTASKTLAGNLAITISGTPVSNTEVRFLYFADVTLNGNTFSIMGVNIPEHLTVKQCEIIARYINGAWKVVFIPDGEDSNIVTRDNLTFYLSEILDAHIGAVVPTTTTTLAELKSTTIAANTFATAKDSMSIKFHFTTAANANAKSITLKLNSRTLYVSTTATPNNLTCYGDLVLTMINSTDAIISGALHWSDGTIEVVFDNTITGLNFAASQNFQFMATTPTAGDLTMNYVNLIITPLYS